MQITMTQVREKQEARSKRSKANGQFKHKEQVERPTEYVVADAEEGKHRRLPWKTMKVGDRMFIETDATYTKRGHGPLTHIAHLRSQHRAAKGRKKPRPWAGFEFTMIVDEQNGKEGVSVWRTK